MKKIYSFLFAAVTVFAAASCQKEVDNNVQATPAEDTFTVTATVGLDTKTTLDENGKSRKWMVENSWGADKGFRGNLIMTDEWFDKYVFNVVIERQYIPEDILKMLKQKPTMLPLKKYRSNK